MAGQTSEDRKPEESARERFLFSPPIDIFETDEGLVLHADLPGVSIKTLELQVQDNKLTLFGASIPWFPRRLGRCTRNTGSAIFCGRSF